jgi:hypothetical protein
MRMIERGAGTITEVLEDDDGTDPGLGTERAGAVAPQAYQGSDPVDVHLVEALVVQRGFDDDLVGAEASELRDVPVADRLSVALGAQGREAIGDHPVAPLLLVGHAGDLGWGHVLVAGTEGAPRLEERKVGARMPASPRRPYGPFGSEDHPPSGGRILS